MAEQEFYIGGRGPYTYDDVDTDTVITTGKITAKGTPTGPDDLVRKNDLDTVATDIPNSSTTVTSQTSFGESSDAGSSTTWSRGDHSHGTPANPVSGFTGTVTVITNSQLHLGVVQVKTTLLTYANGLLTSVGAESGWTNTPL
jgi:hypothetical protein